VLQVPAINTANAIQSGFILSVLGNIKSFFDLALSKSQDVNIVLSGGDAEYIYQHLSEDLKNHTLIKKDLVLDGLFVLANH
jgi:pantothenate kinase type III